MMDSGLTFAYAEQPGPIADALTALGYEVEEWPTPVEKPKYLFNRRTGLRVKLRFDLSRARWECSFIWER